MPEEPNGRGLVWLLAAKVACCGGLLLVATGALSLGGLADWLFGGGYVWVALAVLAIAIVHLWNRRRSGLLSAERREERKAPRGNS